jgi:hypothetical protein
VNDISSCTIARDLVLVLLLEEIADAVSDTAPEHVTIAPKALVTLFFAFVAYVMPPNNFQHLQEKIQDAIDLLEEKRSAHSFLHLYDYGREPILRALVSWRKQVADAYPFGFFVAQAKATIQRWEENNHKEEISGMAPEGCEAELEFWAASAMLLPPESDPAPELRKLLRLPLNTARAQNLQQYIEKNWKPNVTLVDVESLTQGEHDFFAVHPPFSVCTMPLALYKLLGVGPVNPRRLFDYVKNFFIQTAQAFRRLGLRLVIEVIPGDLTRALEGIRHGAIKDRPTSVAAYSLTSTCCRC